MYEELLTRTKLIVIDRIFQTLEHHHPKKISINCIAVDTDTWKLRLILDLKIYCAMSTPSASILDCPLTRWSSLSKNVTTCCAWSGIGQLIHPFLLQNAYMHPMKRRPICACHLYANLPSSPLYTYQVASKTWIAFPSFHKLIRHQREMIKRTRNEEPTIV